jgi:hypothetical protein
LNSDLHADADKCQHAWIENNCLPKVAEAFNVLIVPGDVGTDIEKLLIVFERLSSRFDVVCYIPGNHETWISSTSSPDYNSIDKLMEIYGALSQFPNVVCGPLKLNYASKLNQELRRELVVLPLHAWYHASWDKEPHITHPLYIRAEKNSPFGELWIDYRRSKWPTEVISKEAFKYNPELGFHPEDASLAEAFAKYNEQYLHAPPMKECGDMSSDDYKSFFGSPLTNPSNGKRHYNLDPGI